ncbi:MAG: ABC transporter substrate-binding protein [Treponema sp.]|jgi:peptide/nickel transport system substrate-binding protein|nr:ABC transporter substrate-binding protein [Treponema sp.]
MKKTKILLSVVVMLIIATGTVFASGATQEQAGGTVTPHNLPRNQTLYFAGLQWGAPSGYNPYVGNASNFHNNGHRQVVYETLMVFNLLDGKLYPQIADSYSWSGRNLTVQLNRNVKFSNGQALTAADVVYTYNLAKTYSIGNSGFWDYLESVTAQGDYTVVFAGKAPPYFNMKQMEAAISEVSITSRAYWEGKIASGELGTGVAALGGFAGWDCIGTGPYMSFYHDDTKLVVIRNENYWGQHSSRYGKLPAPKYLAHNIYATNAAGDLALRSGQIDVSQQYTANVQTFFQYGLQTYVPTAPYHIPGVMPSIIFNTKKPGLDDPAVRRAIAMVLDYNMIGTNAMTGQTAPKVASMMVPLPAELALIDNTRLAPYQWTGIDVAGANKLLDDAGWVRGADGVRAKGGVRLDFNVMCPAGWSDWNASCEVVAQATGVIGIRIVTRFPEQAVWNSDRFNGTFDIVMDSPGGQGMASPWSRANAMMGSNYLPADGVPNMIGNWGRYSNPAAQALIDQIPNETDPTRLRQLWTDLNILYLQEMPTAGLMYRPWVFHVVGTSTWTGFPAANDGSNVPPTILIDGYGVKGLYNLRLK